MDIYIYIYAYSALGQVWCMLLIQLCQTCIYANCYILVQSISQNGQHQGESLRSKTDCWHNLLFLPIQSDGGWCCGQSLATGQRSYPRWWLRIFFLYHGRSPGRSRRLQRRLGRPAKWRESRWRRMNASQQPLWQPWRNLFGSGITGCLLPSNSPVTSCSPKSKGRLKRRTLKCWTCSRWSP